MSGKQQSKGGGGAFSHSQSQPGDNTSILMGLSAGIIWPQMFFPPTSSLSAWKLSLSRTPPPPLLSFSRQTNLFGLVAGRRSARRLREREHNQDVRQSSSSPVISARWEISSGFAFSHDSTAGTRRQQPPWPWSSDYSLNTSWHCQERAVWWLRLSNDSCWEELRVGGLVSGGTPQEPDCHFKWLQGHYAAEKLMMHISTCLSPKREIILVVFPEQHVRSPCWCCEGRKKRRLVLMQSFSHQEKRAKIFSRESRSYLSNSPQTNLAILHDEYSYKKWGWRRAMVAGGARWGFLIRTVYLVSTKNKIKTVVRRSPSLARLLAGDGGCKTTARPV